jgi:hypothetical protein
MTRSGNVAAVVDLTARPQLRFAPRRVRSLVAAATRRAVELHAERIQHARLLAEIRRQLSRRTASDS